MWIVFLTGAGMSAESGVPTFRDALTGLWQRFDAEALATEAAYRRDPGLCWGWYRWRAKRVQDATPNAGHLGIAELARSHGVTVITQNVDDLHERAGTGGPIHLHGSLFASRCLECGAPAGGTGVDPILRDPDRIPAEGGHEPPPRCAACRGLLRPGVVWFGEALPQAAWEAASSAIAGCDLLVVIGTSGLVYPAAGLPERARDAGARIIEINPQASAISRLTDEHWPVGAGEGLARLRQTLAD